MPDTALTNLIDQSIDKQHCSFSKLYPFNTGIPFVLSGLPALQTEATNLKIILLHDLGLHPAQSSIPPKPSANSSLPKRWIFRPG